ncbi:MAG: hypothetical protein CMC70_01325 [Flavobacteriaceae bacterium]|nr:hypothetical protein [Flavobacteriaceae bacterium]
MATDSKEVELLREGLQSTTASKGSFALNLHYFQNAWHVRKGFGQKFQRSTEFSTPFVGAAATSVYWGFVEHMGSKLIRTNFGHDQLVSVFAARVRTGAAVGFYTRNLTSLIYTVTIDDLTTGDHWEEALYPHTSAQAAADADTKAATDQMGLSLPRWHGCYEVSAKPSLTTPISKGRGKDYAAWLSPSGETLDINEPKRPFFFCEYRDNLIFGSPSAGLWSYFPASYRESRRKTVNQLYESEWMEPYSESSAIKQISLCNGPFSDGYRYFRQSTFEPPRAATVLGSRVVYAGERSLYFSDSGFPASIMATNVLSIDSDHEITAIQEQMGNLLIFTKSETFLYRPQRGLVVSGGQLDKISEFVGCENAMSIVQAEGNVFWADSRGVHRTTGNMSISTMTDDIDDLFTTFITNPLTSYYAESGVTTTSRAQPKTVTKYKPKNLHLTYSNKLRALFLTMPEENASLCWSEGKWSLWTTESNVFVSGGSDVVGTKRDMASPWIVASESGLYMVTTASPKLVDDAARYDGNAGTPVNEDVLTQSYCVLEYGRGGAIDRSVDDEDQRKPSGYWEVPTIGYGTRGYIYFDPPFRLDTGYQLPVAGVSPVASNQVYMVQPISVVCPTTRSAGIDEFRVIFDYDTFNWDIQKTAGSSTNCLVLFPSERIATGSDWLATEAGSTITLQFQQTGTNPDMNLSVGKRSVLCYLIFKKANVTTSVSSPAIQVNVTGASAPYVDNNNAGDQYLQPAIWKQYFFGTDDASYQDNVAQPVDWAYKSEQVGMDESSLLKARGLYARVMSHGAGASADYLEPSWTVGVFNTVVGSDRKGWMSQVVDYTGTETTEEAIQRVINHATIRTRILSSASTLLNKTFGTALVQWGASGANTGSYLIDDEETSVIATSDSVKGQCFSYMLFGHIQNRAQALEIESVKAALKVLGGGRRRKGH